MADRELTTEGVLAVAVASVIVAASGTAAILAGRWQVAAIGVLWAALVVVLGALADRFPRRWL